MYFSARKLKMRRRRMAQKGPKIIRLALIAFFLWLIYAVVSNHYVIKLQSPILFIEKEVEIIRPIPDDLYIGPKPTPLSKSDNDKVATRGAELKIVKQVEAKEPVTNFVTGIASYYSKAGCLGCSANLTMANGETLDDTALTLALTPELVSKHKLLNDIITVQNVKTGDTVKAKVTDTGGFARHGRVADLSVATKNAIKCASLCEVKVIFD